MKLYQRILRLFSGACTALGGSFLGSSQIYNIYRLYRDIIYYPKSLNTVQCIFYKGIKFLLSIIPMLLIVLSLFVILIGVLIIIAAFAKEKSDDNKIKKEEYTYDENDDIYKEI